MNYLKSNLQPGRTLGPSGIGRNFRHTPTVLDGAKELQVKEMSKDMGTKSGGVEVNECSRHTLVTVAAAVCLNGCTKQRDDYFQNTEADDSGQAGWGLSF